VRWQDEGLMEDEIESGVNAVDKDLSCHLPRAASFNERGL